MTSTRLLCTQTFGQPVNATPGVPPNLATYYPPATQGAVVDIPGDASCTAVQALLSGARYFVLLGQSGPTTARPSYPPTGMHYINTDISGGVATWFDGSVWRQASGQAADTVTAGASFTTSSGSITLSETAPSWVVAGMSIYDVINGQAIGTVESVSGTTVTLTADAAHASAGSADLLLFH